MNTMGPLEFSIRILGLRPYGWQAEAMEAVGMGLPCSVVAANGSGKTANLVAPLILWFLWRYPKGQVVFTSGSFRQIKKQLWPSIKRFRRKFPSWEFMSEELRTPEGGFAIGFSADDAGTAEGWHPKEDDRSDPVFIIIDEAKTVPDAIFEAFDRCTRICELWVSSPGTPRGQFYDSFHKNRSLYWTRQIPSVECPHISAERRERDLIKYGIKHPLFRSKHLAEFTEDSDRLIMTGEALAAVTQPVSSTEGEVVAFCDFAAGRDENVLAVRRGNTARIVKAWVERDTVQAVREFIHLFDSNGLRAHQIWGDADGLGKAMIDALAEAGWRINKFYGGQAAVESEDFVSLIAETWHVGCREILAGRINVGELDPTTYTQLTTRQWEWGDKSKLRIEDKEKMRAHGLSSPDRADALLGCIMCGGRLTGSVRASDLVGTGLLSGFDTELVTGW
jgi:phage terminase large subunit